MKISYSSRRLADNLAKKPPNHTPASTVNITFTKPNLRNLGLSRMCSTSRIAEDESEDDITLWLIDVEPRGLESGSLLGLLVFRRMGRIGFKEVTFDVSTILVSEPVCFKDGRRPATALGNSIFEE